MNSDGRETTAGRAFRFRLSTLLLTTSLIALLVGFGVWINRLEGQIVALEQQLLELAIAPPPQVAPASAVGVPFEIDRAMMMDGMQAVPGSPAFGSTIRVR